MGRDTPTLICPYCGKEALWCDNKEIYGRSIGRSHMIYYCGRCDAYVGCHNNTTKPLGTMANKELRQARIKAHDHLDKFWKSGTWSRTEMYTKVSIELGKRIHMGESDLEMCQKIIALDLNKILKEEAKMKLHRGKERKRRWHIS
jgi:hypothetical protein